MGSRHIDPDEFVRQAIARSICTESERYDSVFKTVGEASEFIIFSHGQSRHGTFSVL